MLTRLGVQWSTFLLPENDLDFGFCAAIDSAARWNHSEPDILEVFGVQIGTIIRRHVVAGRISQLLSHSQLKNQNLQYPTGEDVLDVCCRVRYLNRFKETIHSKSPELPTLSEARRLMLGDSSAISQNVHFTGYVAETSQRWIIGTSGGHIGMAPSYSEISKWT